MKRVLYLGIIALLASCSSSKYAANFQKAGTNYGYGELTKSSAEPVLTGTPAEQLVASISNEPAILTSAIPARSTGPAVDSKVVKVNLSKMSKTERTQFKKALKEEISYMKAKLKKPESDQSVKATKNTQMMDHDLRLAIIFGAIGVTGLLIGTQAFYIVGAIALIIGVIFLIMWVTRQ